MIYDKYSKLLVNNYFGYKNSNELQIGEEFNPYFYLSNKKLLISDKKEIIINNFYNESSNYCVYFTIVSIGCSIISIVSFFTKKK